MHFTEFLDNWKHLKSAILTHSFPPETTNIKFTVMGQNGPDYFDVSVANFGAMKEALEAGRDLDAMLIFSKLFAESDAGRHRKRAKYYNCEMCETKKVLEAVLSERAPIGAEEADAQRYSVPQAMDYLYTGDSSVVYDRTISSTGTLRGRGVRGHSTPLGGSGSI